MQQASTSPPTIHTAIDSHFHPRTSPVLKTFHAFATPTGTPVQPDHQDQHPQPSATAPESASASLPPPLSSPQPFRPPDPTTAATDMSAQPNPPLPPLPNFSLPPPPSIPTPPPIVTPPQPQPQPESPKPPTSSPQPPQPDTAPTNPPAPPSQSPSPPPVPPTVVVTSVDTHVIATIVTSTFIRVTNTVDGSSTSTLVGVDSHGSLVPIPPTQTSAPSNSNQPAASASGSPSISSSAAENAASTGLSNEMLAMVVAVPLVVAFFIAIAVTLLKRRSDLKQYEGGIATRPRPSSQPPTTSQSNETSTNNETTGGQACAVDSPLISITPPVHQYPAEQQQEYQPVPQSLAQPATSSFVPNQIDSNVYLDPAPTGGYYQSHPPPSPTGSSTSASGSLFVAPGPPRVVDPTVPMLTPAKHLGGGSRAAAPRRASNLRYSFNGQAATEAAGSLVPGMDEGVQFSKTPRTETGRLH